MSFIQVAPRFLNGYLLPKYRQESLSWRMLAPSGLPSLTSREKEAQRRQKPFRTWPKESQTAFGALSAGARAMKQQQIKSSKVRSEVRRESLKAPEDIQIKRRPHFKGQEMVETDENH